jgi:hypothetical protein
MLRVGVALETGFIITIVSVLAVVLASYFKQERKPVIIGQLEWMADSICCLRCGKHLFYCECVWEVIDMCGYPSC